MVQLLKPKTINGSIIEVLIKLEKEMHEHPRTSKEFAICMHGINAILIKVDKDFGADGLMALVFTIKERIGRVLPLDTKLVDKLVSRGCTIKKVHSIHPYCTV